MKVAVVSDSHDNIYQIEKFGKYLKESQDISFVLHAGDFIAPFAVKSMMRWLDDLGIDWRGVFGNNDGERDGLNNISGERIAVPPLGIELSNTSIIIVHNPDDLSHIDISEADGVDLFVCGHTHKQFLEKKENAVILNPGELCGYLTGVSSFAIVDLDNLDALGEKAITFVTL